MAHPKTLIVTKIKWHNPGTTKGFRDFLKYLQYRDGSLRREAFLRGEEVPADLSDAIKPTHRDTRWVDRGLGETYKRIANQCFDWQGRKTMARNWVIAPDPELMEHIPEELRFQLIQELTEEVVERWYENNGWGTPEYSYVVHDKHLSADKYKQAAQMAHAHVITPGTVPLDPDHPEKGRIDHRISKAQIEDLHRTSAAAFERQMERILGRKRYRQIVHERDERITRERKEAWMKEKGIEPKPERGIDMLKLAQAHDAMTIMKREKDRKAGKKQNKRKQLQEDLRMYGRILKVDRQTRLQEEREATRLQRELEYQQRQQARDEKHEADLTEDRAKQAAQRQEFIDDGRVMPTFAERRLKMEETRRRNMVFWVATDRLFNINANEAEFEADPEIRHEFRVFKRFRATAEKRQREYHARHESLFDRGDMRDPIFNVTPASDIDFDEDDLDGPPSGQFPF